MSVDAVVAGSSLGVLPVDVHVFEHADVHYAFDARNYSILRLSRDAAAVLRLMRTHTFAEILETLANDVDAETVRSWYLTFVQLMDAGTLSSTPVPRPARPNFWRLVIMLAGGCNMGCSYCFERDVPIYQHPNLLSREQADRIVDWFIASHEGPKAHVQFYGGEPLLNFPVLQHVLDRLEPWADAQGIELTKYLITNGTLLSRPRSEYLAAHGVRIQISLDGDAKTHDKFRVMKSGASTFERIYPNLQALRDLNADFNLRAVLTAANVDAKQVVSSLKSLGAPKASFEVVASGERGIDLDDRDWDEFLAKYTAWLAEPYTSWAALPQEVQNTIIKICDAQHVHYGCGAGLSEVTVAPDGSIYECQRIYREPLGHVDSGRTARQLDSQFLTMVDDRPVCQDCWARYLCGGGCLHQSHVGHASTDPLPEYCRMKRAMVEASVVKVSELRDRQRARRAPSAPAAEQC